VLFAVGFVSLFALSVYGYLLIYQDLAVGGLFSLWCFPPFEGRMSYSSGMLSFESAGSASSRSLVC
jgi:hypothetical protein